MNRVGRRETWSPFWKPNRNDVPRRSLNRHSLEKLDKKYLRAQARDAKDRVKLIDWLVSFKKLPTLKAKVLADLCFRDVKSLSFEQEDIAVYFEKLRTGALRLSEFQQTQIENIVVLKPAVMVTVAFAVWMADEESLANLRFFIRKANCEIWGTRWWKKEGGGLTGLVVAEPHEQPGPMQGPLHYHMLLRDSEKFGNATELQQKLRLLVPHIKDRDGERSIMSPTMIHVEPTHSLYGLGVYLTKSFRFKHFENGDFHIPLVAGELSTAACRSLKEIRAF